MSATDRLGRVTTFRYDALDRLLQRTDPDPDLDYDLIEGPFYKGVRGLPGTPPPRSAFHPYAEGTT